MSLEDEATRRAPSHRTESPFTDSSTRVASDSAIPVQRQSVSEATAMSPTDHDALSLKSVRPRMPSIKAQTERPQPQRPTKSFLLRSLRGYTTQPKGFYDDESLSESSDDSDMEPEYDGRLGNQVGSKAGSSKPTSQSHRSQGKSPGAIKEFADPMAKYSLQNQHYSSRARVKNGRLEFSVKALGEADYLKNAIDSTIASRWKVGKPRETFGDQGPSKPEETAQERADSAAPVPKLNIVVMVIGSRGDVQPFLQVGKVLKEHGHRVRLATHPAFKEFVEKDSGLEFFSVGGDPAELMAFMVKNPGLVPSMSTITSGDVGRRRESMYEMMQGFFRACINVSDEGDDEESRSMMRDGHPFVADAIIANPPSFAHIHCAERLGIPLHIMFTMPYTPTQDYPNPLSRINAKKSNVDKGLMNWMSYPYVELMTWQGLGDLVNKFRTQNLGLEPMSTLWAPGQLFRLKVPYTYLWSPALAPKPKDWGPEVNVTGYVFHDLATNYSPPEALTQFLSAGEKPIYIGFGSITIDDPDTFTAIIVEAVQKSGVRALVSKGWAGLGSVETDLPDNIFLLGNCPHDWLFPRVSAVVHHGGAGTTAIGLKCGIPTMIVHFFGDQSFWGNVVASAGAGARKTIPWKKLTANALADGIVDCMSVEAKAAAARMAESIEKEGDGAANAVASFHASLPLSAASKHTMRCQKYPDRLAVWTHKYRKPPQRLSALAATELLDSREIRTQDLRLIHHMDWNDFQGPGEPFTGGAAAVVYAAGSAVKGIAGIPRGVHKAVKQSKNELKSTSTMQRKKPSKPLSTFKVIKRSTTQGLAKSVSRLLHSPLDISLAVTLGFHNAPRLYGDTTVPPPPALHLIHGYKSGVKAGLQELRYGFVEGVTGIYELPMLGAKGGRNVITGSLDGFGKAFGGFLLKPIAGVLGFPTFTGMGLRRELRKCCADDGQENERWIREARILQGRLDIRKREMERARKMENTGEMTRTCVQREWNGGPGDEEVRAKTVEGREEASPNIR